MNSTQQTSKIRTLVYVCPVDHSGTSLFVKGWLAPQGGETKAPVLIVHDFDESTEDYVALAECLAEAEHNAYCFEMRLQPKRPKRSRIQFEMLILDLLQVTSWIKYKESGKKPVIIGKGVGALINLHFARMYSKYVDSLVFICPYFFAHKPNNPLKGFLNKILSQLFPFLSTPSWLAVPFSEGMVHDTKKPWRKGKLTLKLTQDILVAITKTNDLLLDITVPVLSIHTPLDSHELFTILKDTIAKRSDSEKITLTTIDVTEHQTMIKERESLSLFMETLTPWLRANGNQGS